MTNKERRNVAERLRGFVRARSFAHGEVAGGLGEVVESNELLHEVFSKKNTHRPFGVSTFVDDVAVLDLADLIDRPTCSMVDIGDYQPKHRFKRMLCSECGAMHWEQPQKTLPRMRYCPWCGREVVEDA